MNNTHIQFPPADTRDDGYSIFTGQDLLNKNVLSNLQDSFRQFKHSWNSLAKDEYLQDSWHYRRRRYSVLHWHQGRLQQLAHEPHYQELEYNPLHGGIQRDYESWTDSSLRNPCFLSLLNWAQQQLPTLNEGWRIQAHQFRISATEGNPGKPTPEGIHKDGSDYTLIMLLAKNNVAGGVNYLYNNEKEVLCQITLEQPGDCILLDDRAVYHSVSEIMPMDSAKDTFRDTLVLTFHRSN